MKKKIGIRKRLFLEIGAIIAVCLVALAFVNSRLIENVYIFSARSHLKAICQKTEDIKNDYYYKLSETESEENVFIDLYDGNDTPLYESAGSFISGKKLTVVKRTNNKDGSYFNILSQDGTSTRYLLFGKDFKDGRHIEITEKIDLIQENARTATTVTTVLSMAALLISLVFVSFYSKRFTKPLIKMSNVTSKMSGLDFSEKLNIKRNDEIGFLAENINTLSSSLDTALTELKTTNARLTEDIEKERTLEKMRNEFVSAASHELKTPIAIIRGYTEGLKMLLPEDDKNAAEYCDIIMNESDKMTDLVVNLMEASLYSSGAKKPDFDDFDLDEFLRNFMKKSAPLFSEKGINAVLEIPESRFVYGDEKQLERVLSNLVSNACSHASAEKKVKISADVTGEKAVVCVYNSGSHIDDRDKDNIFTSFYRADKAHSRAEGRFGLGLSIVKSIMDLHGGKCWFTNCTDGVNFFFDIEYSEK